MFFTLQNVSQISWKQLSQNYGVTTRTIYDWRKGSILIPNLFIEYIEKLYSLTIPAPDGIVDEQQRRSVNGKRGGKRRVELYGSPGTSEGRKKGGAKAIKILKERGHASFQSKEIYRPYKSIQLAECVGILLGDGGVSSYQVAITLHSVDEAEYSLFVQSLFTSLFNVSITISIRKDKKAIVLVISSNKLVLFLASIGIQSGSKVASQSDVPLWVKEDTELSKACIRGLFDTDGCFYVDTHKKNAYMYKNPAINFTNRSLPLLSFFKHTLEQLGFKPT